MALLWVLALATAGYLVFWPSGSIQTAGPMDSGRPVLVLDAGHGGEDGGAVSLTGVPESQINLAIVQKLDLLLGLCGQSPVVLRQEDVSLHDPSADTLREKKASDLKNRVAMVEGTENGVLLSIHQNMFTDAKYHGAQVFYAPTQGSQEFAVVYPGGAAAGGGPSQRAPGQAHPGHRLPHEPHHPPRHSGGVRFLSNPEEEGKLRSEGYQLQLAAALTGAWLQYSEELGDMR